MERGKIGSILSSEYDYITALHAVIEESKAEGEAKGRADEAQMAVERFTRILKEKGYSSEKLDELIKEFSTT